MSAAGICDPDRGYPLPKYAQEVERRLQNKEFDQVLEDFDRLRKSNPEAVTHEMWESILAGLSTSGNVARLTSYFQEATKEGFFTGIEYVPVSPLTTAKASYRTASDFATETRALLRLQSDLEKQQLLRGPTEAERAFKPLGSAAEVAAAAETVLSTDHSQLVQKLTAAVERDFKDPELRNFMLDQAHDYAYHLSHLDRTSAESFHRDIQDLATNAEVPSIDSQRLLHDQAIEKWVNKYQAFSKLPAHEKIAIFERIDADEQQRLQEAEEDNIFFDMMKTHFPHDRTYSADSEETWDHRWAFLQTEADRFCISLPDFSLMTPVARVVAFLKQFHDPKTRTAARSLYSEIVIHEFGYQPLDWFICASLGLTPPLYYLKPSASNAFFRKALSASQSPEQAITILRSLHRHS